MKKKLLHTIEALSSPQSYNSVYHEPNHGSPMPSIKELKEIVATIREIIFPGYFGLEILQEETISFYTGVNIDKLFNLLTRQIRRGLCFGCDTNTITHTCNTCDNQAEELALQFIETLPNIRRLLATDIQAAYNGDPAAKSFGEIIFCYPVIKALTNYRVAHELVKLNVPLIPRIISEMAHSETGIDIHPEATIGEYFTIDHGTGVVIGATSIIGNHVQLYQGVTLGAKNFPLDEHGNPIKGVPRHPIVEDNVVIYSNATILGRITIGTGAIIGGNVWVTNDVPAGARILQSRPRSESFEYGGGI
ncbi:MAG TPA: serine acetyltransferase [Bacteroidales bacterium]|nr:serine acetyltransferase [Bacteroidales bacterium]